MASRTVGLYKYVPTESGWKYLKAAFHDNNRIKPHAVITPDGEKTIKTGNYYLYYRRKWESVGEDPKEAHRLMLKKRGELLTVAYGGEVVQVEQSSELSGPLRGALDDWLEEVKDGDFHKDTYDAKRLVADEFVLHCKGVKLLSAVTRKHCLTYVNTFLKKKGNGDRTRFNKFLHLRQFLQKQGLHEHLTTADAPDYSVKDPLAFVNEELGLFWLICPQHKQLRYKVLLTCGLRKQEIETLRWVDILWKEGIIRIQPRPEWSFKPKKHHCRDIPVAPEVLEELRVKKITAKSDLVFSTRSGKPKLELWDDVQALFKKVNQRFPNTPVPMEKAHPHTFRATFATTLLRQNVYEQTVSFLSQIPRNLRWIEVCREAATIFMLVSVAFISGSGAKERWGAFLWTFAVWDITYYIGLWATLRWPASLYDYDVLFLIPVPWFAQVWFPVLVSALAILGVTLSPKREPL